MAVNPAISLIGEMSRNLRVFSVKLLKSRSKIISTRLYQAVFLGIEEARFKEEFPQGLRIHLIRNMRMGIVGIGEDLTELGETLYIHIQQRNTGPRDPLEFLLAIDHLGGTTHPHTAGEIDVQFRYDHTGKQDRVIGVLEYAESGGRYICNFKLNFLLNEGMFEYDSRGRHEVFAWIADPVTRRASLRDCFRNQHDFPLS